MPNDKLAADRLQLTLARTTAAALAVSSAEGDVFGGLVRRLAEILEVDAAMIARNRAPVRAVDHGLGKARLSSE